ncbi:alpha/beta fold hydrolase [Nocardioides sp.]|uniref:alpha/beta fold hydrolase n=1 Tax=Nocardioides sp. TaxID=35761 RepID=UPI003529B7C2
METRVTENDGLTTRWVEHGAGRPVVLVHGVPASAGLWRHVQPLVQGRSLAWEMAGYGASIPDGAGLDLSLAAQAGRLLTWLDTQDLDRPVLVGHDLGGGVAQIAAVRAPERFSGLVLTNAVCYDSWPVASAKASARLAPLLRHLPDAFMRRSFAQVMRQGHDSEAMATESSAVHWEHYAAHGAARSLMAQLTSLDARDTLSIADRLPDLGLPARVVWGADDPFQKLHFGERLAADLGTEVRRIPGGSHFTPEDHPDLVAEAINELLAS